MSEQLALGGMSASTAEILQIVDDDYRAERDRELIDDAVRRVAMKHHGRVSTNDVRHELTGPHGLLVMPQRVGPRLATLTRQGVLAWTGEYEPNTDRGSRNDGKPQKVRVWRGAA